MLMKQVFTTFLVDAVTGAIRYADYNPGEGATYYFICSLYLLSFFLYQHLTFDEPLMTNYNKEMFAFLQLLMIAAAISPRHLQSSTIYQLTTLLEVSATGSKSTTLTRLYSTTIAGVNYQPPLTSILSTSTGGEPSTTIAGVNHRPLFHHAYASTILTTTSASPSTSTSTRTVSVNIAPSNPLTFTSFTSTGSTYTPLPEAASQLISLPISSSAPHRVAVPTASETPTLAGCYIALGGVQPDGKIDTGCGSMFSHMWYCIGQTAPWTTSYNTTQSVSYRECVCETSERPFSDKSNFYRNFTGCSHCITLARTPDLDFMTRQLQDIDLFCRSQNPNAYMFVQDFQRWTFLLDKGEPGVVGPLSRAMQGLRPLLTTRPPLANLAYGASAPVDGSLAGVTPSLTTYTTTVDSSMATITSLVTWIPTDAGATYNAESASVSAAQEASSAIMGDLCMGRGPCSINDAALRRPPRLIWFHGAGIVFLALFNGFRLP